jgi:chemotaxis-related protein WspB
MERNTMLLITCQAGSNRYAFHSRDVVEVLPRVNLHSLPDSPPWLAGLLVYRGAAIPVIDFARLTESTPCPNRLSSRIAVLQTAHEGVVRRFGILAEQMGLNDYSAAENQLVADEGVQVGLGKLCKDQEGMFQMIDPASLIAQGRLSPLFSQTAK